MVKRLETPEVRNPEFKGQRTLSLTHKLSFCVFLTTAVECLPQIAGPGGGCGGVGCGRWGTGPRRVGIPKLGDFFFFS